MNIIETRVSDSALIWVAADYYDGAIRTIPLPSQAEVQSWLDGQYDVDARPVVCTAGMYRALSPGRDREGELALAVAEFVPDTAASQER